MAGQTISSATTFQGLSFQALIQTLNQYWAEQGCVLIQPLDLEVGAGTFHPATFLRALGPEPWNAAYVQPSRRPTDGRYGENPNRLQRYYQYQVVMKPNPDNLQELYLGSLKAIGIDLSNTEFWYAFSGFVLVLGAWLALNLYHSPTGRALRALHGSEIAARTVGVDVAHYKLVAFVLSAVYASVSGSLLALQNKFITPDVAGFMHSIEMVTMTVLGGAGSVLGAILGAAILTTLPQVLTIFQEYEQLMLGLVMMLVMIFMREGLLPSIMRRGRGRAE